jgi:hypothetical protein
MTKQIKNPITYYKEEFEQQLLSVQNASTATIKDRISIVSLIPSDDYPGRFGENAIVFQKLRFKRLFLFCYFFVALIDQAIHSALREEHIYFEHLTRYPKFVGILSGYHHNLHPALLLLIATLYTANDEQKEATDQFMSFADFFGDDYGDFLMNKYPELTGRLSSQQMRETAAIKLYTELSNATALLFIPKSLGQFTSLNQDINLYENWMLYFSGKINDKLKYYKQHRTSQ